MIEPPASPTCRTSPRLSTDNPFSGGRIRPGTLEFLFEPEDSVQSCLQRLAQFGGWGQIRGPHGSGKSTLLHALAPRLHEAGMPIQHFTLRDGQRRLPISREHWRTFEAPLLVTIDGYEQLAWWERWRLKRRLRRRGCGLLVTTHRDMGLPDVYVTRPTVELARQVAEKLQAGWPTLIAPADVDLRFQQHRGDLRETMFALYDLYEQRRAATVSA